MLQLYLISAFNLKESNLFLYAALSKNILEEDQQVVIIEQPASHVDFQYKFSRNQLLRPTRGVFRLGIAKNFNLLLLFAFGEVETLLLASMSFRIMQASTKIVKKLTPL